MKTVPLGEVIGKTGLFIDGDWVESKDQDPDGEVRLTQLADVGIGTFLDKSARFLNKETAKRLRCTFLQENDILVARMPDPIGRACIFPGSDQPCVTVVDVCIVRPDLNIADPAYLSWMINSTDFRRGIDQFIKGTTRQRISRKNLELLPIPLPPLEEQKRIAAILDQADALRKARRRAIERLNDLSQSIFYEMFGDPKSNSKMFPVKPLGQLCDVRDGTHDSPVYVEDGFPLLTSKNFTSGRIDFEGARKISEKDYIQINKRSKVDVGDIVMPMIGTIGSPVIIDEEPRALCKTSAVGCK